MRMLSEDSEMLWARPVIALLDGTVICGNQRLIAARALGWKSIPVLFVDLDWERAKTWALRDNNQSGDWDEPMLAELLAELERGGLDLALTGFESSDLDRILAGIPTLNDPDDAPPLPVGEPNSKPGETYKLGPHRLHCGDATDEAEMNALMVGEQAKVLWTDPPYGVDYVGKTQAALTIANDSAAGLLELLTGAFGVADRVLAASAPFYIASPTGRQAAAFRLAVEAAGWDLHQMLGWIKNSFVIGRSDYQRQFELVLYGWKAGSGRRGRGRHDGSRWFGDNKQSDVFFVNRPTRSADHPTMKPVQLITAMLKNSSRRGDIVLDPFAGSGSTLIACQQLGRRCFAMELDPRYCDVIRSRYESYIRG